MKHVLTLAMILLVVAINAWAQPPAAMMEPGDDPEWMDDAAPMAKLDLTAEQKKSMQALRTQMRKEMIPLRGNLESKHIDLQEEMAAEQPNIARINALVDDLAKVKAEIQKKQIAHRLKMRDMLTPEQRKIWQEQRGKRMHEFGREGRPGRGGHSFRGPRGMRPACGVGF